MSLSRRKFMKAGVIAAACSALPLKTALGQNVGLPLSSFSRTAADQLAYHTRSSFAPYVNTQFRVYLGPSNTRGLELVEIGDYLSRSVATSSQTECFSLLFSVPQGRRFDQDTYLMEHDALGNLYLFVVPVGRQGKTARDYYEAVIYRNPEYPAGFVPAPADAQPRANKVLQNLPSESVVMQNLARGRRGDDEVYYFRPKELEATRPQAPVEVPGAEGRLAASKLTLADAPQVHGLRLGMTIEEALALFPGIKNDQEARASLSKPPNRFGEQVLIIRSTKYLSKKRFEGVNQIVFTFLDGRVASLYIGYNSPLWEHVDDFVARFSEGTILPGADSWDAYVGMDTQLKSLKCREFEVKLFAGGHNVNINYVQLTDLLAQKKVRAREEKAGIMKGEGS